MVGQVNDVGCLRSIVLTKPIAMLVSGADEIAKSLLGARISGVKFLLVMVKRNSSGGA